MRERAMWGRGGGEEEMEEGPAMRAELTDSVNA